MSRGDSIITPSSKHSPQIRHRRLPNQRRDKLDAGTIWSSRWAETTFKHNGARDHRTTHAGNWRQNKKKQVQVIEWKEQKKAPDEAKTIFSCNGPTQVTPLQGNIGSILHSKTSRMWRPFGQRHNKEDGIKRNSESNWRFTSIDHRSNDKNRWKRDHVLYKMGHLRRWVLGFYWRLRGQKELMGFQWSNRYLSTYSSATSQAVLEAAQK